MFVINRNQFQSMLPLIKDDFKRYACKYLESKHSLIISCMSKKELATLIDTGIEKAKSYNINERNQVLIFLRFMLLYGINFDKLPDTNAGLILSVNTFSESQKIKRLTRILPLN